MATKVTSAMLTTQTIQLSGSGLQGGNPNDYAGQYVILDGDGHLPILDGSNLTDLNAAELTGALPALDGSALTNLTAANLVGALPAISGASLTGLTAANLTGALPALDGSALTDVTTRAQQQYFLATNQAISPFTSGVQTFSWNTPTFNAGGVFSVVDSDENIQVNTTGIFRMDAVVQWEQTSGSGTRIGAVIQRDQGIGSWVDASPVIYVPLINVGYGLSAAIPISTIVNVTSSGEKFRLHHPDRTGSGTVQAAAGDTSLLIQRINA